MTFITDIAKQTITLSGTTYCWPALQQKIAQQTEHDSPFQQQLFDFLTQWFNDSDVIAIHTSGSTGTPKTLHVAKQKMINSAIMTCHFLQLKRQDKALLCMPLTFIAGKMMVVRALVCGLDLYLETPSGNPLVHNDQLFQFSAMVPLQVHNSLQCEVERKRLAQIDCLLIGGGTINPALLSQLASLPNRIYSTYGMAETLSHIAVCQINHTSVSSDPMQLWYTPFENVFLSLSTENTLIIDAPLLLDAPIVTHDIVEIRNNGDFRVIGRKDNVINSGGIKMSVEEIEAKLAAVITGSFAIGKLPCQKLGEMIILLVENNVDKQDIDAVLPAYQRPKKIYQVHHIPLTESSKINRAKVNDMLAEIIDHTF